MDTNNPISTNDIEIPNPPKSAPEDEHSVASTSIDPIALPAAGPDARSPATSPAGDGGQGEGGEGGDPAGPAPSLPPSAPSLAAPATPGGAPVYVDDVYKPAPSVNPVLATLTAKGLLGQQIGDGEYSVSCPWADEHDSDGTGTATYLAPTTDHPFGGFHCGHAHNQPKSIHTLLDHFDIDPAEARCKPRIRNKRGELHRVVGAAERVLAEGTDYFSSGGAIVAVRQDARSGELRTEQVTEAGLALDLSRLADWEAPDGKGKQWSRCDVPPKAVFTLLRQPSYPLLRPLTGLARQPYFRPDRTFVMASGYDAKTGILASFDPAAFRLPEPTRANAEAALTELKELLVEFKFHGDADVSAALCAILTGAIRSSLPLAPAFSISASSPGSGKSYLASLICPFAGPGEPLNLSYPMTNEEATKLCLSIGFTQPANVLFDDMPTDWLALGAINRLLTSETISERILGTNKVATVPASAMVIGTGNNIRPLRDMSRRVISIYLLPKQAITDLRYTGRPAEAVKAKREHYVGLALTIIRAWIAAGCPMCDVAQIASYGEWSDLCRQPLMWLGEPDPATSLIRQVTHDPDLDDLGALLEHWYAYFGSAPVTVRKLLKVAEKNDALKDVLQDLPCTEGNNVNRSKFGRYLSRYANRIVNGLQLKQVETTERNAWSVEAVDAEAVAVRKAERERLTAETAATWSIQGASQQSRAVDPDEIF